MILFFCLFYVVFSGIYTLAVLHDPLEKWYEKLFTLLMALIIGWAFLPWTFGVWMYRNK